MCLRKRERDGSIIVGPFDTKQAAFRFISDAGSDIVCEIE